MDLVVLVCLSWNPRTLVSCRRSQDAAGSIDKCWLFSSYQTLTVFIPHVSSLFLGSLSQYDSLMRWHRPAPFYHPSLPHLSENTRDHRWIQTCRRGYIVQTVSPFFPLPLCFSASWLLTTGLSPLLYFFLFGFRSIFLFKVFIHFEFILHASLFLIFLPRPLCSRLQRPAMQTQPVLRGSELLKPLLPVPPCSSGLQRKEAGSGGREEWGEDERNGENRFVRRKAGWGSGCKDAEKCNCVYTLYTLCGTVFGEWSKTVGGNIMVYETLANCFRET